jgi:hypothetical protein
MNHPFLSSFLQDDSSLREDFGPVKTPGVLPKSGAIPTGGGYDRISAPLAPAQGAKRIRKPAENRPEDPLKSEKALENEDETRKPDTPRPERRSSSARKVEESVRFERNRADGKDGATDRADGACWPKSDSRPV